MKFICTKFGKVYISAGPKVCEYVAKKNGDNISSMRWIDVKNDSAIITLSLNSDGTFLIIGFADKRIFSWNLNDDCISGQIQLKKRPTALSTKHITLGNQKVEEALIVSDKSGDIWGMDLPGMKHLTLLGGHTSSVITDLIVTNDYLVTCDRDEKIRVSLFPHTETILAYCLGHTNVITSICPVTPNIIVSTSWDHYIMMWDITSGTCLDKIAGKPNTVLPQEQPPSTVINSVGPETPHSLTPLGPSSETVGNASDMVEPSGNLLLRRQISKIIPPICESTADSSSPALKKDSQPILQYDIKLVTPNLKDDHIDGECDDEVEDGADYSDDPVEGDEDYEERHYDEVSAGHYPMKAISGIDASNGDGTIVPLVAVIFRALAQVHVYPLEANCDALIRGSVASNSSSGMSVGDEHNFKFGVVQTYELLGAPVDVAFFDSNTLLVLLEKPTYIQVIYIENTSIGTRPNSTEQTLNLEVFKAEFKDYCLKNGKQNPVILLRFDIACFIIEPYFSLCHSLRVVQASHTINRLRTRRRKTQNLVSY